MAIAPLLNGGAGAPSAVLIVYNVGFVVNTTGLTTASTTAPGTLTFTCSTDVKSVFVAYSATNNFTTPDGTFTINTDASGVATKALTGLSVNTTYYMRFTAYSAINGGGTASSYLYNTFTVPAITYNPIGQVGTSTGSNTLADPVSTAVKLNDEILIDKSLLAINTDITNPEDLSCAVKNTGITVNQSLPAYYAFGSTLFFAPTANVTSQSGGFGFFTSSDSTSGYFIKIKTAESAGITGDEFKILKVQGGVKKELKDNQSLNTTKSVVGTKEGKAYKIDVKVKVESTKITIIAYVNGFMVTATDVPKAAAAGVPFETLISRSSYVSLFANLGTVYFDYVYAMPITSEQYALTGMDSIYNAQMTSSAIQLAYGEVFVSGIEKINSSSSLRYIEEFGPVAREIRYFKKRYDRLPSYPRFIIKNLNPSVDLLAANMSPFEIEGYLINNSGASTPLDTENRITLSGNNIIKNSELVYIDEETNKFAVQEPMTFESNWIQKLSDAKNLSTFIKGQWNKNQRVVELTVFANPMISVSDIISIYYPYHGLTGNEKFVVTNVTQNWQEGLETTITARSIYS